MCEVTHVKDQLVGVCVWWWYVIKINLKYEMQHRVSEKDFGEK